MYYQVVKSKYHHHGLKATGRFGTRDCYLSSSQIWIKSRVSRRVEALNFIIVSSGLLPQLVHAKTVRIVIIINLSHPTMISHAKLSGQGNRWRQKERLEQPVELFCHALNQKNKLKPNGRRMKTQTNARLEKPSELFNQALEFKCKPSVHFLEV